MISEREAGRERNHSGVHQCAFPLQLDFSAVRCSSKNSTGGAWVIIITSAGGSDHFCHIRLSVCSLLSPRPTGHEHIPPNFSLAATLRHKSNHPHLTRKNLRLREGKASAEEMGEPSPPIHALEMSSAKSPYDCAHITVIIWASDFHLKNRTPSSLQVWGKAKLK